jgi:hypothetical protein
VGNKGPVTLGYYTKAACEARWQAWLEVCRRSDEWIKAAPGYITDWNKILEDLRAWKRREGIEE